MERVSEGDHVFIFEEGCKRTQKDDCRGIYRPIHPLSAELAIELDTLGYVCPQEILALMPEVSPTECDDLLAHPVQNITHSGFRRPGTRTETFKDVRFEEARHEVDEEGGEEDVNRPVLREAHIFGLAT
jgi:hypothetical protein